MAYEKTVHASGILAFSAEKNRLRACLIDTVDGDGRLVGWINVQRSRQAPLTDQLAAVIHRLGVRLGRPLWNRARQAPMTASSDPVGEPPLLYVTGAVEPERPLRVWIAGLSDSISIPAARNALASLPADIVGTTSYAGSDPAWMEPNQLANAIAEQRPDILIIVGGYDTGAPAAQQPIAALCTALAGALGRLPPVQVPHLVYAGNQWAGARAHSILRAIGDEVRIETVANLQPVPGRDERADLCRALEAIHWQRQQRRPGMQSIARWVSEPARLTTLDRSFIQLVDTWRRLEGERSLHGLYQTAERRLHVRADADSTGVHVLYRALEDASLDLPGWPPLNLLSGELAPGQTAPSTLAFWDQSGMAPLIATAGQVHPAAMLQILRLDLLKSGDRQSP